MPLQPRPPVEPAQRAINHPVHAVHNHPFPAVQPPASRVFTPSSPADFPGFAKENGRFCTTIPLAAEVTKVLEQETLRAGEQYKSASVLGSVTF